MNVKTKLSEFLRPLALGTLLLCSAAHAQVSSLDRVVAVVDNDIIMYSQLQRRVEEVRDSLTKRGADVPATTELNTQVLERMIVDSIQVSMGERAGIRISDDELNQAMQSIARRNNMNPEQFRAALTRDGLSYDEAREQIRREMVISRVRQRRVADRVQVSEQEVQSFLASDLAQLALGEEYRLATIVIPVSQTASSGDIQRAEQRAQDLHRQLMRGGNFARLAAANSVGESALEGGDIGWRKSAQLPPPFNNQVSRMAVGEISDVTQTPSGFVILKLLEKRGGTDTQREEIHARHILIKPSAIRSDEQAKQLAERIRQRLSNGENFATLAKSFSEDPGSALNGGDLGWASPDSMVPEFRDMMLQSKNGQISPVFHSQFGWHVLEVLERRSRDVSGQAREQQAANLLRNRKYEEELQNWLRQIRDEAYVEKRL